MTSDMCNKLMNFEDIMLREISLSQMINTVYMKYLNQYQAVSSMLVARDWRRGRCEATEQVSVWESCKVSGDNCKTM